MCVPKVHAASTSIVVSCQSVCISLFSVYRPKQFAHNGKSTDTRDKKRLQKTGFIAGGNCPGINLENKSRKRVTPHEEDKVEEAEDVFGTSSSAIRHHVRS